MMITVVTMMLIINVSSEKVEAAQEEGRWVMVIRNT